MSSKSAKQDILATPKRSQKRKKTTPWCNLPTDILLEIMACLSLLDQIPFRLVCKRFFSLPIQDNRAIHTLPWLVTIEPGTWLQINCKLFDFVHKKFYKKFGISFGNEEDFYYVLGEYGKSSKNEWVILSISNEGNGNSSIMFSPFTREMIMLPDFIVRPKDFNPGKITFSTDPSSKECVFFIVFQIQSGEIIVGTYHHGNKNWIVSAKSDFVLSSIESVVYLEGCVYFNDPARPYTLFFYDVAQRCLKCLDTSISQFPEYKQYHLLESNGELLLVCADESLENWGIYMYDSRSPSVWVAKASLPDRALLFGRHKLVSVPAFGELMHMENKIFYYDERTQNVKFYSLIQGKSQSYICEGRKYECLFTNKHYWYKIWVNYPTDLIAKMKNQNRM